MELWSKIIFFQKFSQNFFSTSQSVTLFVKISDFSQIVLWRLHFPVERSAISFFYKPWVIFRHRKKNQKFSNIFSHFFSSSKFSFFRNFQINPFWKFRKFIWRFSKKIFKNFNFFFGKSVEQLLFRAEKFDFFVEILEIYFENFQKNPKSCLNITQGL